MADPEIQASEKVVTAHIGEKIKRLRSFRGMTCAELAEAVGCTRPYLSAVENGRYPASTRILEKLQKALDIDPSYFYNSEASGLNENKASSPVLSPYTKSPAESSLDAGPTRVIPFVTLSKKGKTNISFEDFPSSNTDTIECPGDILDTNAFAIRFDVDSMAPLIPKGSMMIIAPNLPLKENRPALVKLKNEEILCRLYQAEGSQVVLSPFNHNYKVLIKEALEVDWIYPVVKVSFDIYNSSEKSPSE